jgi:hypothetical protein
MLPANITGIKTLVSIVSRILREVVSATVIWYEETIFLYKRCGIVVRVLDYRSRGPGSIPGTIRFSEK